MLPILKVVTGECNSPYLIFDEEYNLADPPVKGTEKNEIKLEKYIHIIISGFRPFISLTSNSLISDKNVEVKVSLEILNIVEVNDQLSQLTFLVQLKLEWNEPRIKTLKPTLLMNYEFSKQCLWSPKVFFDDQISTVRKNLLQSDLPLRISNKTDQVISNNLYCVKQPIQLHSCKA